MMRRYGFFLIFWLCAGILTACDREPPPPDIKFESPTGEGYASKVDFARLEHKMPLTPEDLMKITPANLEGATQEEVDQIYARLTAGPIPDGAFEGRMFFPEGSSRQTRVAEIIGGGLKGRVVDYKTAKLEQLGEVVWKGKVFYRDQRVLRNRINDLALLKLVLGDDIGAIENLEIDGKDTWLLFPAKLYCGQSLLDGRRESIIIDYAFTDDIPGYRDMPDALAGREGLQVRDEIRMVRPGFYLGRAYMKRAFVLNFTLYNKDIAGKDTDAVKASGRINEDCWTGPQRMTAMAK